MQENTDYYNILGVHKSSSDEEIKKAYKKLALQWHPDRNKDPEAIEKFKQIGKAYEVLGNVESRMKYDNGETDDDDVEIDAFTMFSSTFGDFFKMHGINIANFNIDDFIDNSDDIIVDCINYIEVSIEDMYNGATISQQYERYSQCEKCNGFGTKSGKLSNCKKCKGAGCVPLIIMGSSVKTECPNCNGSCIDKSVAKCVECNGAKFSPELVEVDIDILPGSRDGTKIVVQNEGNVVPPEEVKKYGIERSNAVFIIKEKQHDMFKRGLIIPGKSKVDFADLMVELNVTFEESLIGFTKSLPHPSGKSINFTMTEPCRHGDTLIIEGNGMPSENDPKKKGDLFVKIMVDRPIITQDQKKSLSKTLGYVHTPVKNASKYMTLDEYSKKQSQPQTMKQKKSKITTKEVSNKKSNKKKSQEITDTSDESIPISNLKKTKGKQTKKNINNTEMEYPTDSDDDYGLTVFHNSHEKHRPHILTKQPYNMTPEDLQNYKMVNTNNFNTNNYNQFDQSSFMNDMMNGFNQFNNTSNDMDAMKAMEVFKNFPGMQNMMGMNFDPNNECVPFKSNGKGTYTSTVVHPDGHTTTTTTKTFVNGEEMDLSEIPGLDPDFLAGIPELENIPGLHGLFGIGKKKK